MRGSFAFKYSVLIQWEIFAADLKAKRDTDKISVRRLQELIGVHYSNITRVEARMGNCTAETFLSIALWLDKSPLSYVILNPSYSLSSKSRQLVTMAGTPVASDPLGSREGGPEANVVRKLEKQVFDLERMLGRKTMEVEILRERLARVSPQQDP